MNSDNEIIPEIPEEPQEISKFGTPSIPAWIYDKLPEILKKVCSLGKKHFEKNVLLLSSLATLSACFPRISGIYHRHRVYPNLYCYIVAPPASGKALIDLPKNLALPIHNMLVTNAEVKDVELDDERDNEGDDSFEDDDDGEKDEKKSVPEMLIIPADCTATAFNELMINNKNGSLMVETEGTILSERFRSSHGQFRSSFLKAAHHETISYRRRTSNEWKYIESPRLSIVISSTPTQVKQLIPTIEDGLASRFLFYCFDSEPVMENVFSKGKFDSDRFLQDLGEEVLGFYNFLRGSNQEVNFSFSKEQEKQFLTTFRAWHEKFHVLSGPDSLAVVRRLGLATFRICMVLTSLRCLGAVAIPGTLTCSDIDFNIACEIINALKEHSLYVFERMIPRKQVESEVGSLYGTKRIFFDSLPDEFDRKKALDLAKGSISDRTLDRMLSSPLFKKITHGQFRKIKNV